MQHRLIFIIAIMEFEESGKSHVCDKTVDWNVADKSTLGEAGMTVSEH